MLRESIIAIVKGEEMQKKAKVREMKKRKKKNILNLHPVDVNMRVYKNKKGKEIREIDFIPTKQ